MNEGQSMTPGCQCKAWGSKWPLEFLHILTRCSSVDGGLRRTPATTRTPGESSHSCACCSFVELALRRSSVFCYEWTDEEMCTVVVRREVGKALRGSSHQILLTRVPNFLDHMQGSNKWPQSLATLRMFSDGWEQCNGIKPSRNHCTDALLSARSFSISLPRVINRYVSGRRFCAWNQNEKSDWGPTTVWCLLTSFRSRAIESRKLAVWKHLGLTLSTEVTIKSVCMYELL